jgi:hypothetical protein
MWKLSLGLAVATFLSAGSLASDVQAASSCKAPTKEACTANQACKWVEKISKCRKI